MTTEEIVAALTAADKAYYGDGTAPMSDSEYDMLKAELKRRDPNHPALQSLGDDHSDFASKVKHAVRMLSLEKIQQKKDDPDDLSELENWIERFYDEEMRLIIEPKVDGMSAEAKYIYGRLATVSTRGNGVEGDDITTNTRECFPEVIANWKNIPELNVRGELYISKEEFKRINKLQEEAGLPLFANARNLCAGTVKAKEKIDGRKVKFVVHGFGYSNIPPTVPCPRLFGEYYSMLRKEGFDCVPGMWVRTPTGAVDTVCLLQSSKDNFEYYIDGVVIKLNDIEYYKAQGETEHHPKGAVAFKFIPEAKETTVKDIIWQVGGKTGKAVPVAIIEPVALAGSIVERVSLANAGLMAAKGIKKGVKVTVEKANEIIPHVVQVFDYEPYELAPTMLCPCCGSVMKLTEGQAEHTADYICENINCTARHAAGLQQALGTHGLNILGIGPETCFDFATAYPGLNAAQFVQLTEEEYPDSLSPLQKSNLKTEARQARNAPLWRWISAMLIPGVGDGTAKAISRQCKNLREFISIILTKEEYPLDITHRRREACKAYLQTPHNVAEELLEMSLNPESDNYVEVSDNSPFTKEDGFVVSGSFNYGRTALEELIVKMGGSLKGSVSRKVKYVVVGSEPGATKISKAEQLGIPIISETEFFTLLKERQTNVNQED